MNHLQDKAFIFGSVFTLSNKLQGLGDKFDKNLTIKQWLLLAGIFKSESDSPTITEVASLIGNSRQNAKKMVLILEKQGFVTFQKDLNDARILRVSLTRKCRDYLEQRENREKVFLEELFHGFSTNEITSLVSLITKLDNNMIEMERCCVNEKYSCKEKE